MPKIDPKLAAQASSDLKDLGLDRQVIQVPMTRMEAWMLMSEVQLALRHPENVGASAIIARTVARRLQAAIATTPALSALAEMGWNPEYDEPMGEAEGK